MDKKWFFEILYKYRQGSATEQEQRFIESYYDLFDVGSDPEVWINEEASEKIREKILGEIWEKIQQEKSTNPIKKRAWIRPAKVAAGILVLLATGIFADLFLSQKNRPQDQNKVSVEDTKDQVHPGGNKAILTLANGNQIVLDQAQNGTLAKQGSTKIIKLKSGLLTCKTGEALTGSPSARRNEKQTVSYNTISTPRGGQYEIELPDGSKVWLNADSWLRFPTAFTGKERRVEMHGEAYFEIRPTGHKEKQAMAFMVHVNLDSGSLDVKVLGTHFNVNAYDDENVVKTTVTEGAVRISAVNESRILKRGQQARLDKETQNIKIQQVNVDEAMAWKNGLFYFENTNIEAIMREVARWYKVKVVYETKDFNKKYFSGVMSRYSDVDPLLKRLELTGTIHFKREGRTIMVME